MALSKPILVVFFIQTLYTGMFLLSKAAFNVGMNNFIFTFYRQAIATIFLGPIALFLERKNIPPISFKKFWQIFAMSLFGITLSLDLYGIGLTYTSATMGAATTNCLPVITFFLAVLVRIMDLEEDLIEHHQIILIGLVVCTIFWIGLANGVFAIHRRLEVWKIKTAPGIAKLIGVVICLGGAMTLALYKGPSIQLFSHPHLLGGHNPAANQPPQSRTHSGPTWIKGVFILLTGNTFWALWLVVQARIMKGYPSKLLFTALSCFLSSIQSFAIAILVERRPSQWMLGWNVRLLAVAYCGIVVTGVAYYLQAYVIEKKGPVFLALWTPLGLILTMLCSVLLLGEIITLGSVIGGILLVGGLYSFLWAKSKEQMIIPSTFSTVVEADKEGLEFKVIEGTKNSPSIV